ncbi:hypothetical protein KEM56_002805 [Ascosphaera pollenicola]|nr:hypothetical protein KEM56_002805 [Ascosphaera pollenicola]
MPPATNEPTSPTRASAGKDSTVTRSPGKQPGLTTPDVGMKRRRAENAQRTLAKPFRSPLKTPMRGSSADHQAACAQSSRSANQDSQKRKDSGAVVDSAIEQETKRIKLNPTPIAATPESKGVPSAGLLTHSISSSPLLSPSLARRVPGLHGKTSPLKRLLSPMKQPPRPAASPRLLALQRQHSNLLRSLNSARSTLDELKQARRIVEQKQDEQLQELITKWRHVAQSAAEEVFEGAKDRVDKMGGVKAWKEMSSGKNNVGWGWDVDVTVSKEWAGGSDVESEADVDEAKEKRWGPR